MAKKLWISIKRGLIRNPKHRIAMGECIWLFQYMIDVADWNTGKIPDWKDEAAADDMQMPVRTLREQRRKLESLEYISCSQKQYGQEITILEWTNPREYSGETYNQRKGDSEASPSENGQGYTQGYTQGSTQGSTQDVTPTFNPNNQKPGGHQTDEQQPTYNPHNRSGEQEAPDKVAEWLKMAQFPGAKKQARIDAILSYFGGALKRNTETKEWKAFAENVLHDMDKKGWQPERFITWLLSKPDYKPDYWSVRRMREFYPLAFEEVKPVKEYKPLEAEDESQFVPNPRTS
jgi:hypothetical protein